MRYSGVDGEQIRSLLPKAAAVAEGLTPEQLNRRPSEGAWSVLECFDHLNRINSAYSDAIARVIEQSRSPNVVHEPPFRLSLFESALVWMIGPSFPMKVKTTAPFVPTADLNADTVLATWRESHLYLLALADTSRGLDLAKVKVTSPIDARLKVSLGGAFFIICAHDRRHIQQALKAREKITSAR